MTKKRGASMRPPFARNEPALSAAWLRGHFGAMGVHFGGRKLAIAIGVGRGEVLVQHFGIGQFVLADATVAILVHRSECEAAVDRGRAGSWRSSRRGGCRRGGCRSR